MDASIVGALAGIGFMTVVNIVVVAFSYGRMTQKVHDLCRRVSSLETAVDRHG